MAEHKLIDIDLLERYDGKIKDVIEEIDSQINDNKTYDYAPVITIENAVPANLSDCKVKIEPIQDLHGYDKPWVGGAGKNLFTGSDNTYTNDTAQTNVFAPTAVSKELTGAYYISFDYKVLESSTNNQALFYAMSNGSVVSGGNIFNFVDGNVSTNWIHMSGIMNRSVTFDAIYMFSNNKMTVKNVMVSATEGDFEPYTNICPISGHTEVDVQRDGRNRLSVNSYSGSGTWLPSTTIAVTGNYLYRRANFTTTGGKYTFNVFGIKNGVETAIDLSEHAGDFSRYNDVSAYDYIRVYGYSNNASNVLSDVMLCFNDNNTDTIAYEPYSGKTYTLQLGDTIYGGTLDVDSGVMTVNRAYAEFDGSDNESWQVAYNNANIGISDMKSGDAMDGISNIFATGTSIGTIRFGYNNNNIVYIQRVDTLGISDVEGWKTFLSSNNMQIVYPLATPFTVQLTPQQIQLLKGQNTIYASTGQISVTVNGVSGAIGSVQEQVNDHEERIEVVESGLTNVAKYTSNANGEAWQFESGLMICKKTVTQAVTWSEWGALYESDLINFGSFPVEFTATPVVSITTNNSEISGISNGVINVTTTAAGSGRIVRPDHPVTQNVTVGIIAIGRWS